MGRTAEARGCRECHLPRCVWLDLAVRGCITVTSLCLPFLGWETGLIQLTGLLGG